MERGERSMLETGEVNIKDGVSVDVREFEHIHSLQLLQHTHNLNKPMMFESQHRVELGVKYLAKEQVKILRFHERKGHFSLIVSTLIDRNLSS